VPDLESLRRKADSLRALHRPGDPLVLANVWDCASARILEASGAPAIATTSAGVAFAFGYADGEHIPREEMLAAVARIAASVSVPVTADLEAGYGDTPSQVKETIRGLVNAGGVGLNLEDHVGERERPLLERSLAVDRVRAVRSAADAAGVPVVLNARTDSFLKGLGTAEEMLAESLWRGAAYRDAGADCIFVPGVAQPSIIERIVRELRCPINVLAGAGGPPIAELAALGVARVSLGSGPARAALTCFERVVGELAREGTYSGLRDIRSHAEINALMAKGSEP
jgi:2-methylisocitrate lyase-like PEP mutase family enzyme